jgi:hypothetical protein
MVHVAEQGLLFGDRIWFSDTRSPARRMAVSAHPVDGVIIVSLWQGDTCTGTFRLPLAHGARLIAAIADGMAGALPAPDDQPAGRPPPPAGWWRRLATVARRRFTRRTERHLRVVG